MFNLDAWSAAVAADRAISPNRKARARWAGIVALANNSGIISASFITISATLGKGLAGNKQAVGRLLDSGYLIRVSRGRGGGKGATTSVYQLDIPRSHYNATIVDFPTDRAELLTLARQVGDALLRYSQSA